MRGEVYPYIKPSYSPYQIERCQLLASSAARVFFGGQLYRLNPRRYAVKTPKRRGLTPEQLKYPAPSVDLGMCAMVLAHDMNPFTADFAALEAFRQSTRECRVTMEPDVKEDVLVRPTISTYQYSGQWL